MSGGLNYGNRFIKRTEWAHKEGIFETPQGTWIARVRDGSNLKTLSQHETEKLAKKAYNKFYKDQEKALKKSKINR